MIIIIIIIMAIIIFSAGKAEHTKTVGLAYVQRHTLCRPSFYEAAREHTYKYAVKSGAGCL